MMKRQLLLLLMVISCRTYKHELPTTTGQSEAQADAPAASTGSGALVEAIDTSQPEPLITSFVASAVTVSPGTSVTLIWSADHATTLTLNGEVVTTTGAVIAPQVTTTYTLKASGPGGVVEASITVTVSEAPPAEPVPQPSIASFAADSDAITAGDSTTLRWVASGTLTINDGGVDGNNVGVTPLATETYVLKATTAAGSVQREVTVTVVPKPTISSFTATPATITQGQTSTLAWTTSGGTVTLDDATVPGTSKSVSPSTTQTYTLKATNTLGYAVTATKTITVNAPAPTGHTIFVDNWVNGWSVTNQWFTSYAVSGGQLHITSDNSSGYKGAELATTQPFSFAANEYFRMVAKGSGTLSIETADGYKQFALTSTFKTYSVKASDLWSGAAGAFDIKIVAAGDIYIDSIEVSGASACANAQPANPLSPSYGENLSFVTNGKTHYYAVPADYDTECHSRPKKLFVWLHGCGGQSLYDIDRVAPKDATEDWIALAVGGAEGACWNGGTAGGANGIIMSAINDLKTRLAIKPKEIIIGGYSSGGDVGYPLLFGFSKTFALGLFENTAPTQGNFNTTLANAAPPSGWRFPIRHLCHTGDTTANYSCDDLRPWLGSGGLAAQAGHDSVLYELDGTHYDNDSAPRGGTWGDFNAKLRPHLKQTWTSP